jgi:GDP-4-dehydro-6-deoxy-D-mannose reductase
MAARLLVTGIHGFVGRIVAESALSHSQANAWNIVDVPAQFDLRDADETRRLVAAARPEAVIHLAAQSAVPESFNDPEDTLRVNLVGTLHLLEALRASRFAGRLLYVGTGDIYGLVPEDELPIRESRMPRPRNPYAVSKLAAEALCWQWHVTDGLDVVIARPFNHIGPGQSDRFAVSAFARQVAEVRLHRRPSVIHVGNLDTTRDFTDVRDVVAAYFSLLERGETGEIYNVCSGVEYSMRSVLDELLRIAGIQARIELDPTRLRQTEQRRMCGDLTKIRAATGWAPKVPLRDSLRDALIHWERETRDD